MADICPMDIRLALLLSWLLLSASIIKAQQFSFSSGSDIKSSSLQAHVVVGQLFGSYKLNKPSFQEGVFSVLMNSTDLDEKSSLDKLIRIYPNPATNLLKIESEIYPWLVSSASIYSLQGILLYTYLIADPQTQISISQLPTGTFLLRLFIPGREEFLHKLIKIN
jgi:hypothetical protein